MTIVMISPYGQRSPEIGLQYLLARYLANGGAEISQLVCNGMLTVCDRDGDSNWHRGVGSCFGCMQEQRDYSKWSGIRDARLSEHLTPDDIQLTSRWVNGLQNHEILGASYDGAPLLALVQRSFELRFGVSVPDLNNKLHDRFYRSLLLSAVRMMRSLESFFEQRRPVLAVFPAGQSFFARCVQAAARKQSVPSAELTADVAKRCVTIRLGREDRSHECPLLIEDVLSLRADVKTWSPELLRLLAAIESFIGFDGSSALMPAAQ